MLHQVDVAVLVGYLVALVGVGLWSARRHATTDDFMAGSRSLPGWAIGLSMFGSYISSISFLANPGAAYKSNWNAFVFSLATPLAAWIAVRWFSPFYRRLGEASAYEHLERRFGGWARTYAVACFLLTQVARTGVVTYLLAIAVSPLLGWKDQTTILITGAVMTIYPLAGGIRALVWTGVLQSFVLVAGTLLCLATVVRQTPGGIAHIVRLGVEGDKFSLGSWNGSLADSTVGMVLLFGLATHLNNFGVDQSYVQRYVSARSDSEAAKSIWLTTLLYVPVAGVFFFIGTALHAFYKGRPELLGGVSDPDKVFPHFIASQLPTGAAGLVVAAIFAASLDSNLSSMATLTLCDVYKRYLRPLAGEAESLAVLRVSTIGWGIAGVVFALAMKQAGGTTLDRWWKLAAPFSGGVLGLFLLGLCVPKAGSRAAALATTLGVASLAWSTNLLAIPERFRCPLHPNMSIVVATTTIFLTGALLATFLPRLPSSDDDNSIH